jgi:hypothetical protein
MVKVLLVLSALIKDPVVEVDLVVKTAPVVKTLI